MVCDRRKPPMGEDVVELEGRALADEMGEDLPLLACPAR
jgi:hypothetical protein